MSLKDGDTLQSGKIVINKELGQGGFGITYKAWQEELGWIVLKTLREEWRYKPDWEKHLESFRKEGEILAQLSQTKHTNLVQVIDWFEEASIPYLVMDFVEGQNLFKVVEERGRLSEGRGNLSEEEALSIARQVGDALSFMHSRNLIHRDVHPGNIILRTDGHATLIDFGGVKDFISVTQSSVKPFGNSVFAPYEQVRKVKSVRHPNADIYSLAATLYYVVTGEEPVAALYRKIDNLKLIPPRSKVQSISEALSQGLVAGMALDPKNRPQTIEELLSLLDGSTTVTPRAVGIIERVLKRILATLKKVSISSQNLLAKVSITFLRLPWLWIGLCFCTYVLTGMTLTPGGNEVMMIAAGMAIASCILGSLFSIAGLAIPGIIALGVVIVGILLLLLRSPILTIISSIIGSLEGFFVAILAIVIGVVSLGPIAWMIAGVVLFLAGWLAKFVLELALGLLQSLFYAVPIALYVVLFAAELIIPFVVIANNSWFVEENGFFLITFWLLCFPGTLALSSAQAAEVLSSQHSKVFATVIPLLTSLCGLIYGQRIMTFLYS